MDALTTQIRNLYDEASEQDRLKIQEDLRILQTYFDNDWDLVIRMASGSMQLPLLQIGSSLSLFATLSSSPEPLSVKTLSTITKAAPRLLSRLLRAMAAFGLIDQPQANFFSANRTTRTLSNEHVSGAIKHCYDIHLPTAYVFPAWLKEKMYQDITSNKDLPFHEALDTKLTPFEWMKAHPEQMESLGHAMAMQRESSWTDSFPIEKEIGGFQPTLDSAILVDIGGGFGQQALSFSQKYRSNPRTVIVQDIPATLANAPELPGIVFQEHDFFTEQQVKGAKFYYLRHILHDWSDEECIRILKKIIPAMGIESRVVVDEVVLPDEKLPWQAAYSKWTAPNWKSMKCGRLTRTSFKWT